MEQENMSRLFRILIDTKFDEIYSSYKNKGLDYKDIFKKQLKIFFDKNNIIIGQMIMIDTVFRSLLEKSGLSGSQILGALRYFVDKGYIEPYNGNHDDLENIKITGKGEEWLNTDENYKIKEGSGNKETTLNFFDEIEPSNKTREKINKLINEINALPKEDFFNRYGNLIGHQLRTILSLTLYEYWTNIKKIALDKNTAGHLDELIKYTNNNSTDNGVKKNLKDINNKKIKEFLDHIVHSSYVLAKQDVIDAMMRDVRLLLSETFGKNNT